MNLVCASAVGGWITNTITYPLQTITNKMIMQGMGDHHIHKDGMWRMMWNTFKEESMKGFYKGYRPFIVKLMTMNVCNFTIYETMKKYLGAKIL